MNKVTLYSRSIRTRKAADAEAAAEAAAPASPKARAAVGAFFRRHERALWITACALLAAALYFGRPLLAPPHKELTQEDIDAAVLHTLETKTPPSLAAKAYEVIQPSVVRVRNMHYDQDEDGDREQGSAPAWSSSTTGIILTNLHVVAGAEADQGRVLRRHWKSEATVIGAAAGARSRGAAGEDDARRSRARDAALDRAISAAATRWSPSASRSASARRPRPASSPA